MCGNSDEPATSACLYLFVYIAHLFWYCIYLCQGHLGEKIAEGAPWLNKALYYYFVRRYLTVGSLRSY